MIGLEELEQLEKALRFLDQGSKENEYTGLPQVIATSLLIGDFDVHWGNIGVVRDKGKKPKLVRIDFGAAFEKLNKKINPHSISEHLPGFGPTNHFNLNIS